jgi:hypothetical protein
MGGGALAGFKMSIGHILVASENQNFSKPFWPLAIAISKLTEHMVTVNYK